MVTDQFCENIVAAAGMPLPRPVADASRRSLLNVLGTSTGASRSPAVAAIVAAASENGAAGAVALPGRSETLDRAWGALAVGTAAHFDDFDDTHLATVIHPGGTVLATLLALQPELAVDGERYLRAFAIGCEAELRIGLAISPSHYDRGWHITGTCGVFGAAVAAALLLGLDAARIERALALAATMIVGQREALGSMAKPFHVGQAAANGVFAAELAANGADGFANPLGRHGVLATFADHTDERWLEGNWAEGWELERNTFKPYPCGIVAHPLIDAAVDAAKQIDDPTTITSVEITCNPLVPELMGRQQPMDGLQARFSSYHTAAAGLLDGHVGLPQFDDARVTAPDARHLRDLITLRPTPDCPRDAAAIVVSCERADDVRVNVAHARGSLIRPLTDQELLEKVEMLVAPVLGPGSAASIAAAVDGLESAPGLGQIVAAVRPRKGDVE